MSAMLAGRDNQFYKLLAAGADPNMVNLSGNTSLHVAGQINAMQFVLDLLDGHAGTTVLNKQHATFQPYFYMTPANVLSDDARLARERVTSWLNDHNVPVEVVQ
jgi:ankyrin repeat protein